ncbi:hypothetical protein PHYC_03010 [Phycisphaerales bacterium]|nr:hypothetical protein PHYC_03010 [Phycisphaerales bacterium]
MNTKRWLVGGAAGVMLAVASAPADQIVNGGFESGGFNGWTYSGNPASSVMPGVLARDPLHGGTQAPLDGEWDPAEGVLFAALWSTDSQGGGGATLSTQFSALAGQALEFDYFFDYGDFNPYFDWARGDLTGPGGLTALFAHNTSDSNRLADDANVDWTHIVLVLPADGVYTLTFATDDADGTFESILGIDGVFVTPSPAGAMVFAAGALILRRRR